MIRYNYIEQIVTYFTIELGVGGVTYGVGACRTIFYRLVDVVNSIWRYGDCYTSSSIFEREITRYLMRGMKEEKEVEEMGGGWRQRTFKMLLRAQV